MNSETFKQSETVPLGMPASSVMLSCVPGECDITALLICHLLTCLLWLLVLWVNLPVPVAPQSRVYPLG